METKTCSACAEPIRLEAKKCPHCMQVQGKLAALNNDVRIHFVALLLIMGIGMWLIFQPSVDIADFRNQITFEKIQLHAEEKVDGTWVSCIATLNNKSPESWNDFILEARFFNKKNELIDTFSSSELRMHVRTNEQINVRVRDKADRTITDYDRCELIIQDARHFKR